MKDLEQLAFEECPIGIVMSENRVIKSCNRTFATLFGYTKKQLIGESFQILYGTYQEFESIRDIGIEHLKSGGTYSDERIMQRRDGQRFWCKFRARTLTPEAPLARVVMSFAAMTETPERVSLTPRERQVVRHLSHGRTSKEIAQQLSLSPRTIEDVRARLLRKLGVSNTPALLAKLTSIES
ncbi:PAS and helix-turn-helix domain-containing protein [Halocynthiibacter sp. C4]|uniref:PAS and helix-turn-helix domain-containing protein n=1 Tax=Halocynthiibacter sp. C4 TaxID=2992758 RepID=UPI00237B9328|nr:PAS and helix-turn-helix domain-containing protein [Halocynthiibacter sp. C4]MDE0590320.1 PAS and helix-turn-helix domain-containing protein [Halocynthiibacter sp. C4]